MSIEKSINREIKDPHLKPGTKYLASQLIFNISEIQRRPGTGIKGGYWESINLITLEPEDNVTYLGRAEELEIIHGDVLKEQQIFTGGSGTQDKMDHPNNRLVIGSQWNPYLKETSSS